jgi:thiol-disulfide isomerase/thioredoxin
LKRLFVGIFLLFQSVIGHSQQITGKFPQLASQEIRLERFVGLQTEVFAKTQIDAQGSFTLAYTQKEQGVGFLISADNKPFFVLLTGEDIVIKGNSLIEIDSLKVLKGIQNQQFEKFATEQPKREQAMNAWLYLKKMYQKESLFSTQKLSKQAISNEITRLQNEDKNYIASLPSGSYVKWFLPVRKLVSMTATIVQYRPEEFKSTLNFYRQLDYSDAKLYHSGLYKEAIENHFLMLENSGKPLDSVFIEMNRSIDLMIASLIKDPKKLNEATDFLFDFLEKRSLFQSSEYLALKMLNEKGCSLDNKLTNQLEIYRAMKKGNFAKEIEFKSNYKNSKLLPFSKLTDIKSSYYLIVFGASWCPKCNEELPALSKKYSEWKKKGVEVIFIALEEDKKSYEDFTKSFDFPSYTDLLKWESPIVKDYYVFGTPTMFLLNQDRKIILRPNSVNHADAWIKTIE